MFPYLICMSLTAMVAGVLNAYRRFFVGGARAAASQRHGDRRARLAIGARPRQPRLSGRLLELVGAGRPASAQLLWVVLAARRIGFTARFRRPRLTPGVKRLLWLAAPGRGGRRHHADQPLHRPDHRLHQGRRDRRPAICRPRLSAAARRRRHRHRRRAAAGAVARAEGRPSARGGAQPEPRARIRAVPDAAGGDRARHHLGGGRARALRARRLLAGDDAHHRAARSPSSRSACRPSS